MGFCYVEGCWDGVLWGRFVFVVDGYVYLSLVDERRLVLYLF